MAQLAHFEGTLKPYHQFNAEADCNALRKAMKGLGTDEQAIINVLGYRNSFQRAEIKVMYKTCFGKDLSHELASEISGHFNKICQDLLLQAPYYDATELKNAMKGAGTTERTLIEILCSRNNAQIAQLKEAYLKLYPGKNLENDLESETSGHFKRLLVSLVQGHRNENQYVDVQAAQADARRLYEAGENKLGTDESMFNQILCTRSESQLNAIFNEYHKLSKKSIEDSIKSEMSGDVCEGFLAVVRCAQNKPAYFAKALHDCMAGAGTRDDDLCRIIITRCEIDMVQIKQEFVRLYGKTLASFLKGDTSGDYKKILLALIGEPNA